MSLAARAERVALVIGNNAYANLPSQMQLQSPVSDAADVAAALKKLGYRIIGDKPLTNGTREAMTGAAEAFAAAAKSAEAAVFYYSGHGIQVGEDNYLLPTDTPKLTALSMLKNRCILLRDTIMVGLEEAGAGNKVIILDCCRDNPFSAQLDAALAQVGKSVKTKSVGEMSGYGAGFYLAFATSPGSTALDGNGNRNSPFTGAMLKVLETKSGEDIDFFFREVKKSLPRDQVSWTNHSLQSGFALGVGGSRPVEEDALMAERGRLQEERRKLEIAKLEAEWRVLEEEKRRMVTTARGAQIGGRVESVVTEGLRDARSAGDRVVVGGIPFRWCPPGNFVMGSPVSEKGRMKRESQVPVRITKGFYIAETEVTQEQWFSVIGTNPSEVAGSGLPVNNVSWLDAVEFAQAFNRNLRVSGGWRCALPTEAQWEYACRAGSSSAFSFGETLSREVANFDKSGQLMPAGRYPGNSWGVKDMHGNVCEWCADFYEEKLRGGMDPTGAKNGSYRVNRGGCWNNTFANCRSAFRNGDLPVFHDLYIGFRVVLVR